MELLTCALVALLALGASVSPSAAQGVGQVVVTNSSGLSQALRNAQITLIILDPTGQNLGGGRLPLEAEHWQQPAVLQRGRYVTIRSVNGNPTTLDFGRLPWTIIIGTDSSLELRDLIIYNYALRSSATNTSHFYVGGLVSWPSISAQPHGVIKSYNTTQYFWSSTRYTRSDCQWRLASALPEEQAFVTNKRSQQDNVTDERGVTLITESGIFQANFAVSRFRYVNGIVLPISPPAGQLEANSEGSTNLCVPDNSSYEAVSAQQYGADAAGAPPSPGVNVVGIAVGVAVGGAALLAAVSTVAAVLMRRARRRRAAECDKEVPHGAHEGTPQGAGASPVPLPTNTGGSAGSEFESQLFQHGRLRRLGPLEEEQVEVGPLLGRGSFGRVYKGRWKNTMVAIKVVEHSTKDGNEATAEREALLATSLSHPNIISTYKICTAQAQGAGMPAPFAQASQQMSQPSTEEEQAEADERDRDARLIETWMLMEYCERGSLADALRSGRLRRPDTTGTPDMQTIIACLLDIASGMEYLHTAGVLHGDLKPANVLLKATSADRRGYQCKLGDFGLARLLDPSQHTHVSTQTYGTMPYMSPELIAHARLTQLNDVYSFGIVMWQLFTGESPFANLTLGALFFAVVHEKRRPELGAFEAAIAQGGEQAGLMRQYSALMQRCWSQDPAERPVFLKIMTELGRLSRAARPKAPGAPAAAGAGASSSLRSSTSAPGTVGRANLSVWNWRRGGALVGCYHATSLPRALPAAAVAPGMLGGQQFLALALCERPNGTPGGENAAGPLRRSDLRSADGAPRVGPEPCAAGGARSSVAVLPGASAAPWGGCLLVHKDQDEAEGLHRALLLALESGDSAAVAAALEGAVSADAGALRAAKSSGRSRGAAVSVAHRLVRALADARQDPLAAPGFAESLHDTAALWITGALSRRAGASAPRPGMARECEELALCLHALRRLTVGVPATRLDSHTDAEALGRLSRALAALAGQPGHARVALSGAVGEVRAAAYALLSGPPTSEPASGAAAAAAAAEAAALFAAAGDDPAAMLQLLALGALDAPARHAAAAASAPGAGPVTAGAASALSAAQRLDAAYPGRDYGAALFAAQAEAEQGRSCWRSPATDEPITAERRPAELQPAPIQGVVWDGWGPASAQLRPAAEAAAGDAGAPAVQLHAVGRSTGPAKPHKPYMQLAAVWLVSVDARALALCLLEAQLLSGGPAAAEQAAEAARGEDRQYWLTLATRHQLPSLAVRLGAALGADAARRGHQSHTGGHDSGGAAAKALRANLACRAHTELTRWQVTEAAVHAGDLDECLARGSGAAAAALAAAGGHLAGGWRGSSPTAELLAQLCRGRLAHMLQLALDVHGLALTTQSAAPLMEAAKGWPWARWLLRSRLPVRDGDHATALLRLVPEDALREGTKHTGLRLLAMLVYTPGAYVDEEAVAAAEGFPTLQAALACCLKPAALPGCMRDARSSMFTAFRGDAGLMDFVNWPAGVDALPAPVEAASLVSQRAEVVRRAPAAATAAVEHHLRRARPLAALHAFLAICQEILDPGSPVTLTGRQARGLARLARQLALTCHADTQVVAACLAVCTLAGLPTWRLRVDVAALHRIAAARGQALARLQACLAAACLETPSDVGGPAAEDTRAREWALVRALAELRGAPPDPAYLAALARTGSWVRLLAEADTQAYPLRLVAAVAARHLANANLRHHMLRVIHSLSPRPSRAASLASTMSFAASATARRPPLGVPAGVSDERPDLFSVLAAAEASRRPAGVALAAAGTAAWPLLAVAAAAYGRAPAMQCLAAYLGATLARIAPNAQTAQAETALGGTSPGGSGATRRAAAEAVVCACRMGAWAAVLEGLHLFLPTLPLAPAIRLLQAAATGRYAEAGRHLEALSVGLSIHSPLEGGAEASAEWVVGVTWAVADALLAAAPTAVEREAALQCWAGLDVPGVHGACGAARYGLLLQAHELLSTAVDEFITLPPAHGVPAAAEGREGDAGGHMYVDARGVMDRLLELQRWDDAQEWARRSGASLHAATLAHARALLAEWRGALWGDPVLRTALWAEIAALFAGASLPPALGARWLVGRARELAAEGAIEQAEQLHLLLDAKSLAETAAGDQGSAAPIEGGSTLFAAGAAQPGTAETAAEDAEVNSAWGDLGWDLDALAGRPSREELTTAVRGLLEAGDVAGARALARELPSPPIEVALTEAALALCPAADLWGSAVAAACDPAPADVVPAAVLAYLRRKGDLRAGGATLSAQEVLDALAAACVRGAGRPLTAWAAATFRACGALGMAPADAAALGPRQCLRLLLMRGPLAAPVAIEYALANQMVAEVVARFIADAFLKGLLAAHHDPGATEGAATWATCDLVSATKALHAPGAVGSALLAALLERHGGLPAAVEAGLALAAHAAYEAAGSADAVAALVGFAACRVPAWAAAREWKPLACLVIGLGRYRAVRAGLDHLVRADQLELLLSKRSGAGAAAGDPGVRLLRAAVLAAIARERPGEAEPLALARSHFGCTREAAADLLRSAEAVATAAAASAAAGGGVAPRNTPALLAAMSDAVAAGEAFAGADCGAAAARAAAVAVELARRVQAPQELW
ncbi:hypothetical protein WJX81_005997 [Elliptochloris bilobata]|uniref:Protein kinase domain-containing protein n=1 Tax=Elliptochloris bilobata TaxID=381761 RepID=A0AAW1R0G3_9CHLO